MAIRLILLVILAQNCLPISAAEWHAAPQGNTQGDGSKSRPWDLATALSHPSAVKPGDTIWLAPGIYRGGFAAKLVGTPDAPIIVRGAAGAPGERATIDTNPRDERDNGLLLLGGADTVYRDFDVTCSHTARETKIAGSWPADIRRGGVDIRGTRIAALHLIVHDLANGFGFWHEGEGGEIAGCLIYYNGWQGPDRAHGHGIYAQNKRGTKRIADNILFHQFAYGIHAYGSEKAALDGFDIAGNIAFDNGCLARGGERSPGILVGGGCPARRIAVRENVVVGGSVRLGYPWGTTSDDVAVTGNYIDQGLVLRDFRQATIERNTIVAASHVVQLEGAGKLLLGGLTWDRNDYFLTDGRWGQCTVVEEGKSRGMSFAEWQRATGLDGSSTFTKGAPDKLRIVVRPSVHEPGRAHVAVLNPQSLPEVEVDLGAVLKAGQPFRIVSAKDYYGPPVVSGTYSGQPVHVPMKPVAGPRPVGMPEMELPATEPRFAAFVVLPGA